MSKPIESGFDVLEHPPASAPRLTVETLRLLQEKFEADEMSDPVNHPPHYTAHPSGVECIAVTEHMNFCLGNAVKYIWRADLKADAIQDLEKARWYLTREIQRRQRAAGLPTTDEKDYKMLRDALETARSLIIRHHEAGVTQEAGLFCSVCHRKDGTEPEIDEIYAALK